MAHSEVVRPIGEILMERGWVDQRALDLALANHDAAGMRTCSYLVSIGALAIDDASRALGEQHGVAAALSRHLQRRDRELAAKLPAGTAQLYSAVPLGRMASGEVIVCTRDPRPELPRLLGRAMKESVVIAVAPASHVEAILAEQYGDDVNEYDVDLGTQPIPLTLDLEDDPPAELRADADDGIPELDNLQLVELDDTRVSKDPTQSGFITLPTGAAAPARPAGTQPPPSRAASTLPPATATKKQRSGLHVPPPDVQTGDIPIVVEEAPAPKPRIAPPGGIEALALGTQPPTREPQLSQLAETLGVLATARTHDDIAAAAMRFIASRWRAALLLAVEGHEVTGLRGHGPKLSAAVVRSILISLASPSIVAAAYRAPGRLVTTLPAGGDDVHDHLEPLLGVPRHPAAVGINVGSACEYVVVIGDPIGLDVEAANGDLGRIATALAAAYTRLERR